MRIMWQYQAGDACREPKSLHAKLARQAEIEGVSMNTLAVTFLAECLGKNEAR